MKKSSRLAAITGLGLSMLLLSDVTLAQTATVSGGQTLGQIGQNITASLKGIDGAVTAFAWVAAFVLGIIAVFKFKAYSDNPRETPLKTPIMLLISAVLCISIPLVLSSGSKTLFNQETRTAPAW